MPTLYRSPILYRAAILYRGGTAIPDPELDMSLKTRMASDVQEVFLNTDEFAEGALFRPRDQEDTFAIDLVIGDPDPTHIQIDGGQEDRRPARADGCRSLLRAGIGTITGTTRDPMKGDAIIVADGAYEGEWIVSNAQGDNGDGMVMQIIWSRLYSAGGAREVR